MAINQNCAEQMLITAANRCLSLDIKFIYHNKIDDVQLDISPAFIQTSNNKKQMLFTGFSEEALLASFAELDKDKTYFLRTGTSSGAGHYQLVYFTEGQWFSYSTNNNNYNITTSAGSLSERAHGALLVCNKECWGFDNGQYSYLLVEADRETISRGANFIYDCRTIGADSAVINAFSEHVEFNENIEVKPIPAIEQGLISPDEIFIQSPEVFIPYSVKDKDFTLPVAKGDNSDVVNDNTAQDESNSLSTLFNLAAGLLAVGGAISLVIGTLALAGIVLSSFPPIPLIFAGGASLALGAGLLTGVGFFDSAQNDKKAPLEESFKYDFAGIYS